MADNGFLEYLSRLGNFSQYANEDASDPNSPFPKDNESLGDYMQRSTPATGATQNFLRSPDFARAAGGIVGGLAGSAIGQPLLGAGVGYAAGGMISDPDKKRYVTPDPEGKVFKEVAGDVGKGALWEYSAGKITEKLVEPALKTLGNVIRAGLAKGGGVAPESVDAALRSGRLESKASTMTGSIRGFPDDSFVNAMEGKTTREDMVRRAKDAMMDVYNSASSGGVDENTMKGITKLIEDMDAAQVTSRQAGMGTTKASMDKLLNQFSELISKDPKFQKALVEGVGAGKFRGLQEMMAGRDMSSWMGRGLPGHISMAGGVWYTLTHFPTWKMLPIFAAASPRVQGVFLRTWGKALTDFAGGTGMAVKGAGFAALGEMEEQGKKKEKREEWYERMQKQPTVPSGSPLANPPPIPGLEGKTPDETKPAVPGNIDYNSLPVIKNPDGSHSSVSSKSFNIDGKEVLLPTISSDGKRMSDKDVVEKYKKDGKNLGIFNTPEEADAYANKHHSEMEPDSQKKKDREDWYNRMKNPPSPSSTPPSPSTTPPAKPTTPPTEASNLSNLPNIATNALRSGLQAEGNVIANNAMPWRDPHNQYVKQEGPGIYRQPEITEAVITPEAMEKWPWVDKKDLDLMNLDELEKLVGDQRKALVGEPNSLMKKLTGSPEEVKKVEEQAKIIGEGRKRVDILKSIDRVIVGGPEHEITPDQLNRAWEYFQSQRKEAPVPPETRKKLLEALAGDDPRRNEILKQVGPDLEDILGKIDAKEAYVMGSFGTGKIHPKDLDVLVPKLENRIPRVGEGTPLHITYGLKEGSIMMDPEDFLKKLLKKGLERYGVGHRWTKILGIVTAISRPDEWDKFAKANPTHTPEDEKKRFGKWIKEHKKRFWGDYGDGTGVREKTEGKEKAEGGDSEK